MNNLFRFYVESSTRFDNELRELFSSTVLFLFENYSFQFDWSQFAFCMGVYYRLDVDNPDTNQDICLTVSSSLLMKNMATGTQNQRHKTKQINA